MEFEFATRKLEELYYDDKGAEEYPDSVITSFVNRIAVIAAARDEPDLRGLKSLHFEKLKPTSANRYSMRLSGRWRLILTFDAPSGSDKRMVIQEISKHH